MFIKNAIDTDIQSIYEIAQQEGWKTFCSNRIIIREQFVLREITF